MVLLVILVILEVLGIESNMMMLENNVYNANMFAQYACHEI